MPVAVRASFDVVTWSADQLVMAAVVQKTYTLSTGCVNLAGDTLLHEAAAATPIMENSYISRVLVLVISA
jgi:hypothetical protein